MRESLMPIRPRLRPDEWSETYLADLARSFGVEKPWSNDLDRMRAACARGLAEAAGPIAKLRARSHGRPQYGSLPLPQWATLCRLTPLRYCPMCLSTDRYFRTRWRITSLVLCTTHGCHFKNDLGEPGFTTQYKKFGLQLLDDLDAEQIMASATCCLPMERRAVAMVWAPFEAMVDASVEPRVDERLAESAAWALLVWRSLAQIAYIHHTWVLRQPAVGSLTRVGQLVADLEISTEPTRDGALSLIGALRESPHVLSMRRLLRTVVRVEEGHPTVLSRLPLAELMERLAAVRPQSLRRTGRGEVMYRDLRANALTMNDLCAELQPLGAGGSIVRAWVRTGVLQSTRRESGRKASVFIDRDQVRQVKQFLLSLLRARDLERDHRIDPDLFEVLRKLKVFVGSPGTELEFAL